MYCIFCSLPTKQIKFFQFAFLFSVDRNKYQIHIPLPPKIDPTVTMMQVSVTCILYLSDLCASVHMCCLYQLLANTVPLSVSVNVFLSSFLTYFNAVLI